MRITKLKERYRWEPVAFDVADILLLVEEQALIETVFDYHGQYYWIGVGSNIGLYSDKLYDFVYYIDDQEFPSFEEFKANARIGESLFVDIKDKLYAITSYAGNPKNDFDLVGRIKKKKSRK